MKNKRGQLTIFIIIAILIIAGIALFLTLKDKKVSSGTNYPPQVTPIVNYVQQCLDETAKDAILDIAGKGGYWGTPPSPSIQLFKLPYYIKDNKNFIISKEHLEQEISKYVTNEFSYCIQDFIAFPEYKIDSNQIEVFTKIEERKVKIDVNYPLRVEKGGAVFMLKKFNTEIPVNLGLMYNSISKFISQDIEEKGLCISCLFDNLNENYLQATFFDYDNHTKIFVITDPNSIINKKELKYIFANEY